MPCRHLVRLLALQGELPTELHCPKNGLQTAIQGTMANSHTSSKERQLLISEEIYYEIIDILESKSTSFGSQGSLSLYFQGYGNAKGPLFAILTLTTISEEIQLSHLAASQLHSLPGCHDVWPFPPTWNNCSN